MSPKILNSLLLLISFIMYNKVIDPLYFGSESPFFNPEENVPSLVKKIDTYDATIKEVKNIINKATEAKKQYEAISVEDKKKMLLMVPTSIDDIKLLKELTLSGDPEKGTGLPIDNLGAKDKTNGEYSVSFSVLTTYDNFKKYMEYWENSLRLYTINSITFGPGKTEDDVIKFTIDMTTYYMK